MWRPGREVELQAGHVKRAADREIGRSSIFHGSGPFPPWTFQEGCLNKWALAKFLDILLKVSIEPPKSHDFERSLTPFREPPLGFMLISENPGIWQRIWCGLPFLAGPKESGHETQTGSARLAFDLATRKLLVGIFLKAISPKVQSRVNSAR